MFSADVAFRVLKAVYSITHGGNAEESLNGRYDDIAQLSADWLFGDKDGGAVKQLVIKWATRDAQKGEAV